TSVKVVLKKIHQLHHVQRLGEITNRSRPGGGKVGVEVGSRRHKNHRNRRLAPPLELFDELRGITPFGEEENIRKNKVRGIGQNRQLCSTQLGKHGHRMTKVAQGFSNLLSHLRVILQ